MIYETEYMCKLQILLTAKHIIKKMYILTTVISIESICLC